MDPRVPKLNDATDNFARLTFYNALYTENTTYREKYGPGLGDMTYALQYYAKEGWRVAGAWCSDDTCTWLAVLLYRDNKR